ncbi:MAG: hypothetical protein IT425_05240 [Pirellulales bacterium]|nr:hypothetical protein [Pirellulales bacterium]
MPGPAKVYSTEAIEAARLALVSFIEQITDALSELGGEMRRVQEWLEHDRPAYWRHQVRVSIDQVHESQQALHRCLMFPVANERPSCTEERAALKKAQARQAYCEDKTQRVRHWQQTLRHELFEYEGRISQLVKLVEIDVPQAIGVLSRIVRTIEDYQALRSADPRDSYDDISMAREIFEEETAQKETPEAGAPNDQPPPNNNPV